jgi:antitoxin ParD1/3/4
MNVNLTSGLESLVREKVKSGLYRSASEVVREALRLMKERDTLREIRLDALREGIRIGVVQADKGDLEELDVKGLKSAGRKRLARSRNGK